MKKLFLIIASLTLMSLFSQEPYLKEVRNIQSNFNSYMKKDGYKPLGMGGGFCKEIVEFVFSYTKRVETITFDEARIILIKSAEQLFEYTNTPSAMPFLKHCPFDEKYVALGLTFLNKKGEHFEKGKLTRAFLGYGKVQFSENTDRCYKILLAEPYSVAYEKVYGVPLPDRKKQFGVDCPPPNP